MDTQCMRMATMHPSVRIALSMAVFLLMVNELSALDVSLGPFQGPFSPATLQTTRPGPNGAQIFIVQDTRTFGLSGAGVRIGQIEPGEPRGTHDALLGRVTLRGVGTTNNHATNVAGILVGGVFTPPGAGNPTYRGIAPNASLFSTGYRQFQRPANAADFRDGINWLAGQNVRVVNMSAGFFTAMPPNFIQGEGGGGPEALLVDMAVQQHNILWTKSAGNSGPGAGTITVPGDAFNAITVGATGANATGGPGEDYTRVMRSSSRGPTADGRHKPDIVAPGGQITAASFVSGANRAANGDSFNRGPGFMVVDRGAPGIQDPFFDTTPNTTRDLGEPYLDTLGRGAFHGGAPPPAANRDYIRGAINIQERDGNGVIQLPASGTSFAAPHVAGTAALLLQRADQMGFSANELSVKATILNSASKHVRDPNMGDRSWPEFRAAAGSDVPLDDAMGVGQLNAMAAVRQFQDSGRSDVARFIATVDTGGTHTWNLGGANTVLKQGSLVTATMTWNRNVTLPAGADPAVPANYMVTPLANLNLELVHRGTGQVVAQSNSGGLNATGGDNVEHIYFNVPSEGKYALRVLAGPGPTTYGMAWTAGTSDGPAFSVDGGLFNPRRPAGTANAAEGQLAPFGNNPFPNDVHALGSAGPGNFQTEGEIFVSSLDGTNIQRLSGAWGTRRRVGPHNGSPAAMALLNPNQRGVFGLQPNDNVIGLSWGTDGTAGKPSVLLFSVDPAARGTAGTDVRFQAVLSPPAGPFPADRLPDNPGGGTFGGGGEAAGDIFKSQSLDPFGSYVSPFIEAAARRSNRLFIDEEQLGLHAPRGRGTLLGPPEDNLDSLEMDSPLLYVDPDGDGLHNRPAFFALDRWSPSLGQVLRNGTASADDIFVSGLPFDLNVFADGTRDITLMMGDGIDALVLSDRGRLGFLDPGLDEVLFSLDPFSPSIQTFRGASAGDVYYTDFRRPFNPLLSWNLNGSLFASALDLGLLPGDNLNALDIRSAVPEPGTATLLGLGIFVLGGHAWRRRHRPTLRLDAAG